MSFIVREHVIAGQHIRELPDALTVDETGADNTIHLHVKQYIPKNNINPKPGDLTIIALHGNGFCKELYEPLWEHLCTALSPRKRIRSIWMADVAQQGSSYLLNESKLGRGIAWDDHARDVLNMVNHFRKEMPPPILGIGHSMGSIMLIKLATLHPRLFHSVALLDPWLWSSTNNAPISSTMTLKPAMFRKDIFPDLETAKKAVHKNPLFKSWDPKCLEVYLAHLVRPLPTVLHPKSKRDSDTNISRFTLRTPKQMEAYTLMRPNHHALNLTPQSSRLERLAMPYVNYDSPAKAPATNPSTKNSIIHLQSLRPRCLFLYGTNSYLSKGRQAEIDRKRNLEITGSDSGGSGGVSLGCVMEDFVAGGHLYPFEIPRQAGERLAKWAGEEQDTWEEERSQLETLLLQGRRSAKERQEFSDDYLKTIKEWNGDSWSEEKAQEVKAKL